MSEIIPMLQMGIYMILFIMIALIGIFAYLVSKTSSNANAKNTNISFEERNAQVYKEKIQNTYNPQNDDDNGPIQNL